MIGTGDECALTMARVLRLLLAQLDPDVDFEQSVTAMFSGEIGQCPNCLTAMLFGAIGIASDIIGQMASEQRDGLIELLNVRLAGFLDQAAR